MGTRINFKWSVPVTHTNDLLQINRKKPGDRSILLVLKHVPELVSQETTCFVTATNEN